MLSFNYFPFDVLGQKARTNPQCPFFECTWISSEARAHYTLSTCTSAPVPKTLTNAETGQVKYWHWTLVRVARPNKSEVPGLDLSGFATYRDLA